MAQYKKMFTSARIPVKGEDVIRYTSPSSEKVLVISNKQFYIFKTTSQNGNLLPVEALLLQMNRILEDSKHSAPKRTVGAFTADDRDRWAKNRELLSSLSPLNKRYLNDIEECAFVVCLENTTPHSIEEVAQYTFKSDANNRWYDKVLQFIVFANGRASFIGEHSPLDASPISEMMDQVLTSLQPASPSELRTADVTLPNEPEKFQWVLSQEILEDMEKSEAGYNAACSNIDFAILHYKGYGSDWIKNMKVVSFITLISDVLF
jgi:carnitine O-acetyltransferase